MIPQTAGARPANRIYTTKPDHPCAMCGRLCPGRRRRCMTCIVRIRRYRVKAAAVALLGGVATCCGWSGNLAGYVFHHRGGKEFEIGSGKLKPWVIVKAEIAKCELWCARCHAIHHSAYNDPAFQAGLKEYEAERRATAIGGRFRYNWTTEADQIALESSINEASRALGIARNTVMARRRFLRNNRGIAIPRTRFLESLAGIVSPRNVEICGENALYKRFSVHCSTS